MRAHVDVILETLPEFVGESYDEDAWRDCLNMFVERLAQY